MYSEPPVAKTTSTMRDASFRVIHFPKVNRYVAVAWNYDLAVLLSTGDFGSYHDARAELDKICAQHRVNLRWFDGEYSYAGDGQLVTVDNVTIPIGQENKR